MNDNNLHEVLLNENFESGRAGPSTRECHPRARRLAERNVLSSARLRDRTAVDKRRGYGVEEKGGEGGTSKGRGCPDPVHSDQGRDRGRTGSPSAGSFREQETHEQKTAPSSSPNRMKSYDELLGLEVSTCALEPTTRKADSIRCTTAQATTFLFVVRKTKSLLSLAISSGSDVDESSVSIVRRMSLIWSLGQPDGKTANRGAHLSSDEAWRCNVHHENSTTAVPSPVNVALDLQHALGVTRDPVASGDHLLVVLLVHQDIGRGPRVGHVARRA